MAKPKKQAQIRYDKECGKEGYAIEIRTDPTDDWGLDTWYPLQQSAKQPNGDFDFLHWSILRKLSELQSQGYELIFHV